MKKLLMIVMALAAGMAAWGDEAAFARSGGAKMRLDTRTGTRIAAKGARETIAYSPKWGGAASCTVTADGATLKTASDEGEVAWSPTTTGAHTLTHTAGSATYTAQLTVLGDDVTQHAGALATSETWASNTVHLVTVDVTVPSGKTLTIEPGAVVKFMTGTSLTATGTCMANGVIFTHVNDDTAGGDTLMDGDAEKPVMDGYTLTGNLYEDDATEERYTAPQTLSSSISGTLRLKGHKVYLANSSITVNSGATLTLMPGAIIKFASGCSMTVNGTLDAQGTRAAPIVFTSAKDDEWGGDTNGDGESSLAQPGDWRNIVVTGSAKLSYTDVLYGGGASTSSDTGMITVRSGGKLDAVGCVMAHGLYDGVFSYGTITGEDLAIYDCDRGVNTSGGSGVFKNCVIDRCRWGVMSEGGSGTYYNCIITRFFGSSSWPTGWGVAFWSGSLKTYSCCVWSDLSGSSNYRSSPGTVKNISADPLFLDPDNGDFRIAANSPCVDAGDGTVAPAVDFYGQPRMDVKRVKDTGVANADGVCPDIGIYEVPGSTPVPMPDLAVLSVSGPATAVPGEEMVVTYVVTNRGAAAASGIVRDQVMLKGADAALGGQEVSAGVCSQAYGIEAGAAATFTARVNCPAVKGGNWSVAVTVNAERDVFEQNFTFNTGWAVEPTAIELAELAIGESRFSVGAGTTKGFAVGTGVRVIRVMGDAGLDKIIVFGANGAVPASALDGVAAVRLDDGAWLLVLPEPTADEKGYVVIANDGGTAVDVKVTAETETLAVLGVAPSRVAAVDGATVTVTGTGLGEGTAVTLGGRTATRVVKVNGAQIVATFDLKGLSTGAAEVAVDGGAAGVRALPIEVYKTTQGPKLEAKLELPNSVRDGRIFTAYVVYANVGDEPMAMPVFKVARADSSTKLGLTLTETLSATKVFVGGISPNHPAGVLQPGDGGRIPVYFQPYGSYRLTLSHTKETDSTEQFKAFGGVKPYLAAMSVAATRLNLRGRTTYTVRDFVDQALWEKNGVACAAVSGHLRDALTREPIANVGIALMTTNGAAATATTDSSGYFQLTNLGDGKYLWRVENGCSLAAISTNAVVVAAQGDLNGCEVFAMPGAKIDGHVTSVDGFALGGATVVLEDQNGGRLAATEADENGYFTFAGLSAGTNRVTSGAMGGYVGSTSEGIVLDDVMRTARVELQLQKGATIRGSVAFAGTAVTNGNVQAITPDGVSMEVVCDEGGNYLFDGLPAGRYAVRYYSATGFSDDTSVVLAVGDAKVLDLVAVERPLFVPTAKMGFGQLTTQFVFTDRDRMTNVVAWAWDFDSDGTVDSTSANPSWTYSRVGTNSVTLTITENGGKVTRSRSADCCIVEAKLATVYKANAVVFGYNSGTLTVTGVQSGALTMTGNPAAGTLSVGMVIMGNKGDDYFVRRIVSAVKNGEVWTLTTEDADWSDVYEQYTESFVGEVKSGNQPSLQSARLPRLAAASSPVKMFVEGGVSFSISAQPDLRLEIVRKVQNGQKYERTALVGSLTLGGAVGFEGNIGARWEKKAVLPFTIETPPFWGITVAPIAEVYAEAEVKAKGEFGVEGSVEGAVVVGMEKRGYEDAHWLPPLSFTPSGSVRANVEGSGHFKFGVKPGVKVSFIKTANIKLALDGYAKFELKAGTQTPAEVSLTAGVDLTGEANLIDWEFPWVDVKVGVSGALEGPKAQFFRWTGPDPDFSWRPSGELTAPCQVVLVDESTGDVVRWFGLQYEYSVKAHEWEFPDGGSISSGMESSPYFSQDGKYRVGLHAIGQFVTGPCKKWRTIVVGKEEQEDDGEDNTDDNGGGNSEQSWDPNEMAGPLGVGELRYVKPGEWMTYTVYFENKADAAADAQEVWVTNPLSEYLDWSTFEMGEVAFNNRIDLGLDGRKGGVSEATLNGSDRKVRTEVALDTTTGEVSWYLRIVDPNGMLGWPDDGAGFLPPNDETHCGEGHLTYRVKVREDAPLGARIDAAATIVFDYNDPIPTDPAWWNTVGSLDGAACFATAVQTVDEGGALKIVVNGGNMDLASSVQVQVMYNTAAAADLDLKNATVNGEKPKSFKFPVTLNWAAGEVGEKTIEIPVVVDKAVEADEMLTLQLVNPMNLTIAGSDGEGAVVTQGSACTVTIRDPEYGDLKAKVVAGSATKAEADALAKADKVFVGKSYVRVLANDATRGKVAGSALAADGKNVTLKATANKGWVFAGWYTDAACTAGHELAGFGDYRNPSLAYVNTNGAVTVYARFIAPEEDSLALGEDFLPGEFAPGADCRIAVPVESVSYPTVKVTGLPAGMKFADKETLVKATKTTDAYTIAANTIYGAPTKAAAKPAVVTVTVKNLAGYQIVRQYEITVKEGMSPVETQARVVSEAAPYQSVAVDVADDFSGTVSGAGVYQAGKKVTLKATANKGFVFSGWYEGEGLLTRVASFGFTMPSNDVSYVARFVTDEEDAASIATGLNGIALDPAATFATNVMTGVALQWPVAADALSQTTVTVSGLPAGLKFTAKDVVDSKTKQVTVPANTIYGAPTAASKTDRSGTVTPFAVNVTATTAGKAKRVYPLALTVDPLPVWTVGTFNGPALLENMPNGLATLTIANTGKISGKLLTGGLTWSLAAGNFIDYSPTDGFLASLIGTSGKLAFTNELTVTTDALGGLAQSERFMAAQNNWKVEPWKSRAATFGKTAAVVMSVGGDQPGEISLKFATSGAVTAAGAFKTGVDAKGKDMVAKATCATAVCPDGAPDATGAFEASVFVYFPPKGAFAGYSACIRLRWDGTQFVVP